MPEMHLQDNAEAHRFELVVDGKVVGMASYRLQGDCIALTHTEVAPGHEGKGYGSLLARRTLDAVREQRRKVIPACAFISDFIRKHHEYADMVQSSRDASPPA